MLGKDSCSREELARRKARSIKAWMFVSRFGTVGAFLAMIAVFSVIAPGFLSMFNVFTILRQIAVLGILGLAMTMVMATGGIDLTIGEATDVGGLLCMASINAGLGWFPSVLVGLGGGMCVGAFNSVLIAGFGVMPFLATLGVHSMLMSLEMVFTKGGLPIYLSKALPKELAFIGRGFVGKVPVPVILLAVVAVVYYVMFHKLSLGRRLFAVGQNPEASMLSGINAQKVTATSYILASVTAAFAGVILASRVSSGQPLAGEAYLLDCIAAVIMGRTISVEGKPNILGTLIGAAFLGTIINGMTLLNVVFYMQTFIKGALLLGVLSLASYAKTQRG